MNVAKIYRKCYGNLLTKFRLSHSASVASTTESDIALLKEDPKGLKNASGLSLVAVENYSPLTQISVVIKAGSRNEKSHNLGISHCLRNCSVLSSKNHTSFALTRHLELQGSQVIVSSTREYVIYTLQCVRDYVDSAFPALTEFICHHALKPWEVSDSSPRMKIDLAILKNDPESVLIEALHKVAMRGGLDNSIYSPTFMIGKHTSDMLHDFVEENFTFHQTSISGLGISYENLDALTSKFFTMKALSNKKEIPGRFGGGEQRIDTNSEITRVAIAAEGAALTNINESLALGVLQCVLGNGAHTKHSSGRFSKLGVAAAKATSKPCVVSCLNIGYSDTGMFGVYIAGQASDMREVVKSVVAQMRDTTKSLTEAEIQSGKHALKAHLMQELNTSKALTEHMGIQMLLHGQLRSSTEVMKAIDGLTAADINAVACKIMKMKPAMVSIGQLHNTPYLEELL